MVMLFRCDAGLVGGLLDENRHFLGARDVDGVAGSLRLHFVAVRALGVHALRVGVDGPVGLGHHVPARLELPSGVGDWRGEHLSGGGDKTVFEPTKGHTELSKGSRQSEWISFKGHSL
jgi:hypothetical protein